MRRMKLFGARWWALTVLCTVGLTCPATAIYLDSDQNISFRTRIYSQASIRIQNSGPDTIPTTKAGQLVQHRNFYNPELDAKLTSYLSWMKHAGLGWLQPDDFSFRGAGWGFYDGIYDYGSSQFNKSQRLINANFPDVSKRTSAFLLEGDTFNAQGNSIKTIFPGAKKSEPRELYASFHRVNELYLSYSKGPIFIRFGRQAISWGEADTIALLDQNNPFNVTLGAPGIFQDLDEARIPLWTLRGSVNLFDSLGPFSSGFIEAYWVPGQLDTNTGFLPMRTASPYSPRGADPQSLVPSLVPIQFVLLDNVPEEEFRNSRWGVRGQTVINRFFTVSAWYYTAFPSQPAPLAHPAVSVPADQPGVSVFTTETIHKLTSVFGIANTFFFEPLDTIVRMEAEYFYNEPSFIPEVNLGIKPNLQPIQVLTACNGPTDPQTGKPTSVCKVPKADYLRWELGFDRFFFFRPLNPTNSFTFVIATVGSWNLDETDLKDYRFAGQVRPGKTGTDPNDFVDLKVVEAFAQARLQTDYLHGRLSPGITYIQNFRGTYAILPGVRYRWTDWLLFDLNLVHIGGEYQQIGFFRDRDQISLRVTYQLN